MRTLRIAAAVEAASLIVLLVNLLTVHAEPITSLCGPLHGTAYLVAIAMTWTAPGSAASRARPLSLVPGVGAMLALRRLNGHAAEGPAATRRASQAAERGAGS
ncbi:hypothetical protein [Streptomyces solaniscabiei]|uniref:hypothetical protein n=1 Tax=Streptomyces solaniscabiei TaxID=2683255 RepID=UPI001CE311D3|nr:hypothetical protein [Streptomyces solaniscabiei]